MAKFFGVVGYGISTEIRPGVWKDVITEHQYMGDVVRDTRQLLPGEDLNYDISVGNAIEIVADAYANDHIFAMRYVEWSGSFWIVRDVENRAPRLLLRMGGVYNGPRPAPATP